VFELEAGGACSLGGCHFLDDLVAYGFVEARKKIMRGSGEDL
jgi:hypothetical protein